MPTKAQDVAVQPCPLMTDPEDDWTPGTTKCAGMSTPLTGTPQAAAVVVSCSVPSHVGELASLLVAVPSSLCAEKRK